MVILCFTVEVRVKAGVQQEPVDCLTDSSQVCSIFSFKPTSLHAGAVDFKLAAGTILYRDQRKEWNFVQGTLRVGASANVRLLTKVGEVLLAPGIQWLQWRDDKLWVYTLEGGAQVNLGSSPDQPSVVPSGFHNWYSLVNREGKNGQGFIRRINPAAARVFLPGFGSHPDYKATVKKESRSIAMASDFYGQVAQRMSDDVDARERAVREQAQRRLNEEKRIRQMFRDKYFSPVELSEDDPEIHN
jgi:hypothetical protein